MSKRRRPDPTRLLDEEPVPIRDLVDNDPDAMFAEGMTVIDALDILRTVLEECQLTQRDRNAILRLAGRYV